MNMPISSEANIKEPIQGMDYNAKVASMSKAAEAFSRDIAEAIKKMNRVCP